MAKIDCFHANVPSYECFKFSRKDAVVDPYLRYRPNDLCSGVSGCDEPPSELSLMYSFTYLYGAPGVFQPTVIVFSFTFTTFIIFIYNNNNNRLSIKNSPFQICQMVDIKLSKIIYNINLVTIKT